MRRSFVEYFAYMSFKDEKYSALEKGFIFKSMASAKNFLVKLVLMDIYLSFFNSPLLQSNRESVRDSPSPSFGRVNFVRFWLKCGVYGASIQFSDPIRNTHIMMPCRVTKRNSKGFSAPNCATSFSSGLEKYTARNAPSSARSNWVPSPLMAAS